VRLEKSLRAEVRLLNRTRRAREHVVRVRSDQPNRSHHQNQNNRKHDGIFGDVLPFIPTPKFSNQFGHLLPSKPQSFLREEEPLLIAPMMHAAQAPCQMRDLAISTGKSWA
jgi:hypothetical protein